MFTYIARHWRGELRLRLTWWVNCVALTAILLPLVPRLAAAGGLLPAETAGRFAAVLALQAVQIGVIPLWQMVGLWRAADHHMQRRGTLLLGRITQVTAVLFTLLISMRGLVFASEQVIAARVAFAFADYAYEVSLLPGGREIEVRGGLGYGAADAVADLLARNPGVRRIRLDSGGGALSEAQRLRDVILKHSLDTYSSTGCSSACVSAFIGGRFRYLQRGARMGVHLPRNWEPFSTNPISSPYLAELGYFRERGIPDWFLSNWIRSRQRFWYPTDFQLQRSGVVDFFRGLPPPLPGRRA